MKCFAVFHGLTVPFLGHHTKAESCGRENESVVMILVANLKTMPGKLLHVNRCLNHVSVGVQEMAAHQQSELFWRCHLQNEPQRWRQYVLLNHCYLTENSASETRRPWYERRHTKLLPKKAFSLVPPFLFNDVLSTI